MRVEELSVGDYVRFNGSPYIVEEISGKGWIHILDTDTKARVHLSTDYILDFIDGVPLTPEILINNGYFLLCEEDRQYRLNIQEGVFVTADFKDDDEPWACVNNNCYHATPYCKYVHHLQHAMRLCGIYLDFKV